MRAAPLPLPRRRRASRVCSSRAQALRQQFPQFDERGPGGGFKQQDADEFLSALLTSLAAGAAPADALIPAAAHDMSSVDALFGIDFSVQCVPRAARVSGAPRA